MLIGAILSVCEFRFHILSSDAVPIIRMVIPPVVAWLRIADIRRDDRTISRDHDAQGDSSEE